MKLGVRSILSISALCALMLLIPLTAYADSVTLTSVDYGPMSGTGDGRGNVYPYGFTVNGGTTIIPLMCLSYESEIEQGETWTVTTASITSSIQYEEAAYIFSQTGTLGAVITQWANWELMDPSDPLLLSTVATLTSGEQGSISNLLTSASLWVAANPDSPLYQQYIIYLPVDGSQNPLADGTPQILIGETPEPSSLILLGSGLLGLAAFCYSRKRNGLKA